MIWSILSNLLWSISSVFWKKSLVWANIPKMLFRFLWELAGVVIAVILIFVQWFDFHKLLDWKLMWSIVLIMVVILTSDYLSQKVYKKEKLSTLMPYENLNSVLSIIAWYFIFKDASLISVGIAILVVVITIVSVIDFKNLTLPKNMWLVLIYQVLNTIEILMTWYFLKNVSNTDYFILYEIVIIFMLLFPIFFNKEYHALKTAKPVFYKDRFLWSIAGNISFLLYLFLVWEFGVVVSIMLGFLGDGITLLFGFFFLKDKPKKKDIILLIITWILIWVWFYFK